MYQSYIINELRTFYTQPSPCWGCISMHSRQFKFCPSRIDDETEMFYEQQEATATRLGRLTDSLSTTRRSHSAIATHSCRNLVDQKKSARLRVVIKTHRQAE